MRNCEWTRWVSLAVLLSFVTSIGPVSAENWPQWRGARSDGVSIERGIALRWNKQRAIRWRAPLPGQGGATPVVWYQKVFLTSADGDDLVVMCLASDSGKTIWKTKVASGNQSARAGEGNSASPSPITDGSHVWVFFSTGILACLDVDGHEVWKFDIAERFGTLDIQFGLTSTPVLDGDDLYLQLIHGAMKRGDPNRTGKVIKLDRKTGATRWEIDRVTQAEFECKHSYASPFIYDDGKQRFLVVHGADCTTGHSLSDGKEIWRLADLNGPTKLNERSNDPTFRFVASPLVIPGSIIVPTAKNGPAVAINAESMLAGELSKNASAVRWVYPTTPDVSIPLVVNGLVYFVQKNGKIQCLDLATGKEYYSERLHNSEYRASPVYVDGHIYICARDGMTSVIKAGKNFELVAENDLGEPITASPVVANGVLYLRTFDALYSIKQ
ncbi:MAG: PQQ-binding-like beta-propeller repeat protein [Pirellulaceae bacterium]|nr:PQQ-binding-like beta-propeller repeat protein [Pirellulaceae bacterium]